MVAVAVVVPCPADRRERVGHELVDLLHGRNIHGGLAQRKFAKRAANAYHQRDNRQQNDGEPHAFGCARLRLDAARAAVQQPCKQGDGGD